MTFCLGIKLKSGFIGIADTRLTSGHETTTAKKVFTVNKENHSFLIMTSGLRSVRDKAITYFKETIEHDDESFDKLFKAVNAFSDQVKKAANEDKKSLRDAGLSFNLHAIIAGQLQNDEEHKLFLLYPEGNWVEILEGSPFVIIGNRGYGKPILDRVLTFESSLKFALKAGFLAFDATRISANDVAFPIDVSYYLRDSYKIVEHRFEEKELQKLSADWNTALNKSINNLEDGWVERLT